MRVHDRQCPHAGVERSEDSHTVPVKQGVHLQTTCDGEGRLRILIQIYQVMTLLMQLK